MKYLSVAIAAILKGESDLQVGGLASQTQKILLLHVLRFAQRYFYENNDLSP